MALALRDIFDKAGLKVFDYVIIFLTIALSAGLFAVSATGQATATQCVVEVNGEEYARVDMISVSGEKVIKTDNEFGTNTIVIDRDGVRITHTSCPDKTEVIAGRIDKAGQCLVCLPNRLVVRLEGKTVSDAVSW